MSLFSSALWLDFQAEQHVLLNAKILMAAAWRTCMRGQARHGRIPSRMDMILHDSGDPV